MAEVFRAVMPGAEGFKRTLVIKRILGQLSESADFVEMFVREARIVALLNHPNIVQVYDFGSVDGNYFLAMEYLRGRDLMAIMRRLREMDRPFPIPVAAFVAHQVAGCLAYAHALSAPDGRSLDIIHRDVSPSNVMCLRTGGVKLLDFGIATAADTAVGPENSEQGAFKGKIAYIAPERVKNEPFDGRADLFSLGVVLWEMLTCRRLFRGANEIETWKKVIEMPIPLPSSLRPDIPASLEAVVMRALERDPARRYATGQAMVDDLEAVLRETRIEARMLPSMLVDLFGLGTHSSQIAMAGITPELLGAVERGTDMIPARNSIPLALPPQLPAIDVTYRPSRRAWGLGAGVVGVAALAGVLFGRVGGAKPRAATAPQAPISAAAGSRAPAASAAAPTAPSTTGAPPAIAVAPRPRKPVIVRKVAVARSRIDTQRIASGLSIDPFAATPSRGRP